MEGMTFVEFSKEFGWYLGTLSFVLGAIVGSFLNVCIYRVPAKRSIVHPRSHCYQCGSMIAWYDNVPIFSYLLLGGMCRRCGAWFSSRYMWVELLTGLLFLGLYLRFGPVWAVPLHFVFAALLVFGTFTDVDHFILPDSVTLGGLVFALLAAAALGPRITIGSETALAGEILDSFEMLSPRVLHFVASSHFAPLLWAVFSAAFGWALLAGVGAFGRILFRKEAMGGGDIKLFAFLGAYLGALNCIWVLFLSAFIGSFLGIGMIVAHKVLGRDETETLELGPKPAVKLHDGIAGSRAGAPTAEKVETGSDPVMEDDPTPPVPAPITIRIVRRSARQLHHFPFGPYIALAAMIVLFFQEPIRQFAREALMLPDLSGITRPAPPPERSAP